MCTAPAIDFLAYGSNYRPWLDSALCCASAFYCHFFDYHILCHDCYTNRRRDNYYEYLARHYVHIGDAGLLQQCQGCETIVTRSVPAVECNTCSASVYIYVKHLRESDKAPPENIIISISKLRQCLNPEE